MNNLPKIFGTCKAGCQWETIHRSEFEAIAALVKQYPQEDDNTHFTGSGKSYPLEVGKEYKAIGEQSGIEKFNAVVWLSYLDTRSGDSYARRILTTPPNPDLFSNSFTFKILGVNLKSTEPNTIYEVIYEYCGVRYGEELPWNHIPEITGGKLEWGGELYVYNADATIKAENGKSAYEIAVENGFEGTEQEWIASVTHGADGKTPYIKDGTWWIGDIDTGVKAEGEDGTTQLVPLFANSIEECTDTSKLYVLPDGYTYGYIKTVPEVTYETHAKSQWNGSGQLVANDSINAKNTNCIPCKQGDQFIYTGNGKWNASVYWLNAPITNYTQPNNGLLVSKEIFGEGDTPQTVTVTAPAGASYVMFVSWSYGSATLEVTPLTASYQWASTGHAFVPTDYEGRIIALEKNMASNSGGVLCGKKYVACGDSFTAGDFASKTEDTWSDTYGVYKTYPYWIASRNNMSLVNEAKGGSDFTNISGATNAFSVDRYKAVPTDADYITLMFGLNETGIGDSSAQIGTNADTTNATLWGAYNIVFEYFLTNMPYAKIGVIIADAWMTTNYANAVKEICKYWGIPYLDLKGDDVPMGIGGRYTTTSAKARQLRNNAFQVSSSDSHPNVKAHEYRSTIIENFLRSL